MDAREEAGHVTFHDPIELWTVEDLDLFLSEIDEFFALINVSWMGVA